MEETTDRPCRLKHERPDTPLTKFTVTDCLHDRIGIDAVLLPACCGQDADTGASKDWNRWVSKVGVPDNYIFYRYDRKGVTEGYCTYCEKEVPIAHPRHNKQGTCPCCWHKITYKSEGKAVGVVRMDRVYMYLMQRCEDGVMIRGFEGERIYRKEDYRNEECHFTEVRRVILDREGYELRAYSWGL